MKTRFRYMSGVRYVAPWRTAPLNFTRCGACGRAWDDGKPTAHTPAPSARCPFEHMHRTQAADRTPQRARPPAHPPARAVLLAALQTIAQNGDALSNGEMVEIARDALSRAGEQ